MRLNKEDYRQAVGLLKRYNYNCLTIMNIRNDIMSIGEMPITDMPRVPYGIGDTTLNKVIQLEDNKYLQKCIQEVKIVNQALLLVSKDSKYIFEEMYMKGNSKWEILSTGMSERTFARRKGELIQTIDAEIKKVGIKLA